MATREFEELAQERTCMNIDLCLTSWEEAEERWFEAHPNLNDQDYDNFVFIIATEGEGLLSG